MLGVISDDTFMDHAEKLIQVMLHKTILHNTFPMPLCTQWNNVCRLLVHIYTCSLTKNM